ncbi:MAG: alcohol dehydrogenase [Ramlibacter sp.]|nr:alcohol dehydrogenase [Ramlibacter sp.]
MPPLPAVPGNEMAGVVSAVGAQVDGVRLGQHVLVSSRELPVRGGCYADAVAVPAEAVFALPSSVSFTDAVSLPNYQLAGALLYESGVPRPRSIAVYGASGGVGLAVSQLATAGGIHCIGIVSAAEKAAFVRAAGITEVLLRTDDLPSRVMQLTQGRGVDVVYSHAGPDMIRNLDLLAPRGTLLSYSHLGGFMPEADFYGALRQRLGRSLGVRVYSIHTLDDERETRRRLMNEAIDLMARGKLKPPAPTRWPLSRAADAHAAMESRQTLGKLVLIPDSLW